MNGKHMRFPWKRTTGGETISKLQFRDAHLWHLHQHVHPATSPPNQNNQSHMPPPREQSSDYRREKRCQWGKKHIWSTPLNNISQIGSFPLLGMNIKNIWNHHPVDCLPSTRRRMKRPCLCHRRFHRQRSGRVGSQSRNHQVMSFSSWMDSCCCAF